jgi:hypothetical protein
LRFAPHRCGLFAAIPNAGATSITISTFNIQHSKFVVQHLTLFMFLNFLMVQKPYIPLYSLYGKKLISITISKFNIQNSKFVVQHLTLFMSLNFLMVQKPSMAYMV